jgi:NAD(P)-dependent dehydrogenase (short-subunit alcohol dehydrogenase family)
VIDPGEQPVDRLLRLDGKVAVVTGAARGIGRAIAARLAEAGAATMVTDLDEGLAREVAAEIGERTGSRTLAARLDVADPAGPEAVAALAADELGGLDIWVNNAGIFPAEALDPMTASAADFERVLAVNLTGSYMGLQAAGRRMTDAGGGVILNIASTAAYRGAGPYSASKWALRGMTKGAAAALGPHGIRVVAIAPTLIETPGIDTLRETAGEETQRLLKTLADTLPLGRVGQPDDIARVALFLVSDAAAFVTGVTVPVDGGELAP